MDTSITELKHASHIKGPEGSLYVEESGTGDLPVMFLHSFGGSTAHWDLQREHLQSERWTIAFDFRGHGRSDTPSGNNYTAEALAEDVAAVADSLNLKRFVLIGHSVGGAAAVAYTAAHPEKVAGLVLAGTPGKSSPEQSKPIIDALESDAYEKVMDDYMKQLLSNARPGVAELVANDTKTIPKEVSLSIIKAMFRFNPVDIINGYSGPILIISTPRENSQPNALHHLVPGVPNKVIEGTSHWTQLDKPEEFNRILDDFLRTVR